MVHQYPVRALQSIRRTAILGLSYPAASKVAWITSQLSKCIQLVIVSSAHQGSHSLPRTEERPHVRGHRAWGYSPALVLCDW